MIEMIIEDNGKGFEKAFLQIKGNGLLSMQKRAKEMNATLLIETKLNKGTKITLRLMH
jgi:signal transduction histidine kinase